MTRPVRLRLSRAKGFDLQALSRATNGLPAVVVARPSMWGNPYRVYDIDSPQHRKDAVDRFARLFDQRPSLRRHSILCILKGNQGRGEGAVDWMRQHLPDLRGHNLACWCGDGPCHADVLLELANPPGCEGVP